MTSFISSIDSDRPFRFVFKRREASEILPAGRAAFTWNLPPESFSMEILSPGCTQGAQGDPYAK
jgi:hypothetical protein